MFSMSFPLVCIGSKCKCIRYKAAYRPSELLCPLRYQWVPFDIAKPLLDRKPYVVLSESSILQNGESSSQTEVTEDVLERHLDVDQEDANDVPMDEDEEMVVSELESSDDDEPSLETTSYGETDGDVNKVLLGLKGSRLRYKDLRGAFGPEERSYLESQLQRYKRVVGPELCERMVYSLG